MMIPKTYRDFKKEFKDNSQFKAQGALTDLVECICEINPSQRLPIRVLIRITEWCAEKAIYWGNNKGVS